MSRYAPEGRRAARPRGRRGAAGSARRVGTTPDPNGCARRDERRATLRAGERTVSRETRKAAAKITAASPLTQVCDAAASGDRAAPCDQSIDDHDQGDHEQNVDQTAADVKREKSECPQDEQDDRECPKHDEYPRFDCTPTDAVRPLVR